MNLFASARATKPAATDSVLEVPVTNKSLNSAPALTAKSAAASAPVVDMAIAMDLLLPSIKP